MGHLLFLCSMTARSFLSVGMIDLKAANLEKVLEVVVKDKSDGSGG